MLDVKGIDCYYGQFQALDNISMTVNEKELVMILGPNGHGKSTLLKNISGLLKPKIGKIYYHGKDITDVSSNKIVEMGITYVAEERRLFGEMNVLDNLYLGAYNKNARQNKKENLKSVFEIFPKLDEMRNRFASTLSGGEARMLAIGRGLMSNAELLLLDEPSLGLSPILKKDIYKAVKMIINQGISIVLVEQGIPQLSEIADRIYLLEEGKITFEGNKDDALKNGSLRKTYLGM